MAIKCCVCKKTYRKGSKITFHRLPKDIEIKKTWLAVIGNENIGANIRICSNHFKPEDLFRKSGGSLYIRKGVIPCKSSPHKTDPTDTEIYHEHKYSSMDSSESLDRRATVSFDSSHVKNSPHKTGPTGAEIYQEHKYSSMDSSESLDRSATVSFDSSHLENLPVQTGSISKETQPQPKSISRYSSMGSNQRIVVDRIPTVGFESGALNRSPTVYVAEAMTSEQDIDSCSSHGSSSTLSASETEDIMIQMSYSDIESAKKEFKGRLALINRPQKSRSRRYVGDLTSDDFDTPEKAKESHQLLNKTMLLQKQKIQDLQATVTFLRNRVKTITDEINSLRNKSGKTGGSETTITSSGSADEHYETLLEHCSVQRPELAILQKSELSSECESTRRTAERIETDDAFTPTDSDVKCEIIDIGEIKLEPMDTAHDYCTPTGQSLSKVHESIKTEYIHPVKTEIVNDTLNEANATKQQIYIKSEEIDLGEIKLEHVDPADSAQVCFVPTSPFLTNESNIKKECIDLASNDIENETLGESKHQSVPPLYFYKFPNSDYVDFEDEIDNLAKSVTEIKR